jgi:hypothetical protein
VVVNVRLRFNGFFAPPNALPRCQEPCECDSDDQTDNRSDCAGQQRFGLYRLIGDRRLGLQSRWRAGCASGSLLNLVRNTIKLLSLGLFRSI